MCKESIVQNKRVKSECAFKFKCLYVIQRVCLQYIKPLISDPQWTKLWSEHKKV